MAREQSLVAEAGVLTGRTPWLTEKGTEEGGSGGVVSRDGKVKGGCLTGGRR